tara:strand:- start:3744 stop:6506 length:2763 start_codon:yes stop_codon:yes gene_type:complete
MNKKKKKYKLNKNVKKAVDGQIVEDVVEGVADAPEAIAEWFMEFLEKLFTGIAEIDLGAGLDSIVNFLSGGGGNKITSKRGTSEGVNISGRSGGINPNTFMSFTNLPGMGTEWFSNVYETGDWNHVPMGTGPGSKIDFPEGVSTDEISPDAFNSLLDQLHGYNYDYQGDIDKKNRWNQGNWSRRASPVVRNYETEGGDTLRFDEDWFHRIINLHPEVIAILDQMRFNFPKRTNYSSKKLQDKYKLKDGRFNTSDRRFLQDIEPKALMGYIKDLQKGANRWLKHRTPGSLPKGNPLFDLFISQALFNDPNMTLQDVDQVSELLKGEKVQDAIADKYPDFISEGSLESLGLGSSGYSFNPGAQGGAYEMRGGTISDEFKQKRGPNYKFVSGTPQSYIENFELAGFENESDVNDMWLYLQNVSMGEDKKDNLGKFDVAQKLLESDDFFVKFNEKYPNTKQVFDARRDKNILKGDAQLQQWINSDQIHFDAESGRHYRTNQRGANRIFLTPDQEGVYRQAAIDKWFDNSGWQSAIDQPTESLEKIDLGMVPSSGVDNLQLSKKRPLSFTSDDSVDVSGDINDINNNQGSTNNNQSSDFAGRQKKSINAILSSVKNQTHVKTGEEYGGGDLKRDANIIKKEFGDEAYDSLMKQLEDLPSVRETSSSTVVEGGDVDNRVDNRMANRDRSRVNKNNNKQPLVASAEGGEGGEGGDADKSVTEQIQNIRNRKVEGENELPTKEEFEKEQKERIENQEKQWMAWNAAQQAKNKKPWWAVSDEYEAYTDYTPIFAKDGAFGPKYKSFKSFENGGTVDNPFKSAADKFRGRGSSGFGSGFKIPTLYESREDTTKAGEIYLEAKIIGIENEIDKFKQIMDVDSEEDKAKLAAMQTSLEETKEELFMLRGGQVTRTSINMENNNNNDDNLLEE